MNSVWRLPLVGLVFLLAACQPQQATAPPPPPQVTVSQPVARDVIEWDEYTGQLEAVELVEVRARVSGYLQSVHFTAGTVVKKGALLFVIDPRPYQAELDRAKAALEQAMARFERTQKDFARAQQLVRSRAISQEEVDTRSADQREAQEAARAARAAVEVARLNVEFTQVKAPISGRISRHLVTEGNLVNGGSADFTLLTTIVSLDQSTAISRWMSARISSTRVSGVTARAPLPATGTPPSIWDWRMKRAFHTRATSISLTIDSTRTPVP